MIRDYELKTDGFERACLTRGEFTIEVPHSGNEAEVQNYLDRELTNIALNNFKRCQVRDDVYMNQTLVRQDYTLGTPEGAEILAELKEAFPNYANYERSNLNIVGKYDGYREPYQNPSISWYDFEKLPTESLQLAFSTSYATDNLKEWYGLKFDLVTKDVLLKVVVSEYEGDTPDLPFGESFYAITHSQDGSSSEWIDAYVFATPRSIRHFCENKGLEYPLPPTTHTDCDVVWCWGFVFNKDTLEYGAVKGYARYNQ